MRQRRLTFVLPALAAVLLGACAAPQPDGSDNKVAAGPRDCEPQTGTRVPASCTRPKGTTSSSVGNVQTMERPTRIELSR
ncbi:hypothetical protein [Ideonella sp.]|uniref:hypothetical protein n=1 Tax=Ideonella sp. TaxID=1929293 RepID=UPI002B49F083|nr:hypothetical protein [Ideonella sp.]HJV68577.1 hypothetical protein [Ideonella sp.]